MEITSQPCSHASAETILTGMFGYDENDAVELLLSAFDNLGHWVTLSGVAWTVSVKSEMSPAGKFTYLVRYRA